MEAIVIGLAAKAVEILTPYFKKGVEKFTSEVGAEHTKKVKNLIGAIKKRLSGDNTASENFSNYEQKPVIWKPVIEDMLKQKMLNDKDMAGEIDVLLKELGPTLKIIQKINVVEGKVGGVKAKKFTKGKIDVDQDVGEVKSGGEVIGAEFDEGIG